MGSKKSWTWLSHWTELNCHFLYQGIFLTQGSNPCLLHWQADFLPLSRLGRPLYLWRRILGQSSDSKAKRDRWLEVSGGRCAQRDVQGQLTESCRTRPQTSLQGRNPTAVFQRTDRYNLVNFHSSFQLLLKCYLFKKKKKKPDPALHSASGPHWLLALDSFPPTCYAQQWASPHASRLPHTHSLHITLWFLSYLSYNEAAHSGVIRPFYPANSFMCLSAPSLTAHPLLRAPFSNSSTALPLKRLLCVLSRRTCHLPCDCRNTDFMSLHVSITLCKVEAITVPTSCGLGEFWEHSC